jgi:hypothetical protein
MLRANCTNATTPAISHLKLRAGGRRRAFDSGMAGAFWRSLLRLAGLSACRSCGAGTSGVEIGAGSRDRSQGHFAAPGGARQGNIRTSSPEDHPARTLWNLLSDKRAAAMQARWLTEGIPTPPALIIATSGEPSRTILAWAHWAARMPSRPPSPRPGTSGQHTQATHPSCHCIDGRFRVAVGYSIIHRVTVSRSS